MPPQQTQLQPTVEEEQSDLSSKSCVELYGPYPRAIPVPYLSKKEDIPDLSDITAADKWSDVKARDHRDVGTPDEWVPRDGRLVRLTGRHPFNVEPPMSELGKHKFITPCSLHYVRNHGAVPKLTWEEHTIDIGGPCVTKPLSISMDDLAAMEPRELPVTLVCAGNRRKEQNQIRQTIGFNWGACGVSTTVWKGVLLRDLLLRAGVTEKDMRGKHIEFIGYEDLPNKVGLGPFPEEPWGKQVKYGTSIPLARGMNPAFDVLIAYQSNGEHLQPDHGFPVRLVIPGYIGGRMIKWLKQINVIPFETRNHYHYHDNRILPPHITAEESLKGWWYKPEYIFNELNINSAVSRPDHNETINIANSIGSAYDMVGYAYTGGGRMVTRVEVSVNGGISWNLANLDRKEQPNDYGMYWCWLWWTFKFDVIDMLTCKEIWVRAWDEASNAQPNSPTWNLMGMGNNQVFRIKIHLQKNAHGQHELRFEHPTQPGQQKGGWMTKLSHKPKSAGYGLLLEEELEVVSDQAKSKAKSDSDGAKKIYTLAEVAEHKDDHSPWIIVDNKVYDCTDYLELHPGGADSILINAGADSTEDFNAIHSTKAHKILEKYNIGEVDPDSLPIDQIVEEELIDEKTGRKIALNIKTKIAFKLQGKTVLSHDSFLVDFALQTPEHMLGLPVGKHLFLSANIEGETVLRRYTPISSDYDLGCVKFVIKAYRPTKRFPKGGKMSQYLDSLAIGDTLDIRGPVGEFEYDHNGKFYIDGELCFASKLNMIAGGTGITPVMQIASEILRNPEDRTKIFLVFACREENDLLMRSCLDEWAEKFPHKFQVHYILSDMWPSDWKYSTGFVSKALFEEILYPAGDDVYNLMCGPPIMLEKGCTPNLHALGHDNTRLFSF